MNKTKRLLLFPVPPIAEANTAFQVTSYKERFNIGSHLLTPPKITTSFGKPTILELLRGSFRAKC